MGSEHKEFLLLIEHRVLHVGLEKSDRVDLGDLLYLKLEPLKLKLVSSYCLLDQWNVWSKI